MLSYDSTDTMTYWESLLGLVPQPDIELVDPRVHFPSPHPG
jgi:hypothetical protein